MTSSRAPKMAAAVMLAARRGSDPAGVSGHWIFDLPGGHGILARDDVRAQAFEFLESGGTEIVDPAP